MIRATAYLEGLVRVRGLVLEEKGLRQSLCCHIQEESCSAHQRGREERR